MWIADSYAKINIGLNILSASTALNYSYETGLCFIDWRDRIDIEQAAKMEITTEDPSGRAAVAQAIKALKRYVELQNNYQIKIEKRIPLDSGLGNADSNAALILRMLNK